MNPVLKSIASAVITRTSLDLWPVRVRSGLAKGARWTLFPWTSYWRGTYERALQTELENLGDGDIRGWSCWDLGAHFGLYSIGLARRVGAMGEVAAFEPNPSSFARLERHHRMNQMPWLKLYPAAASDRGGDSELFTYGDLGTTTTHLQYEGEHHASHSGVIPIRTERLDDLVERGELRPPRFVKIDVEGHGHRALAGMHETLASARPIVVTSFHSPQEMEGMMSSFTALRYHWREISGPTANPEVQVGGDYLFAPPK